MARFLFRIVESHRRLKEAAGLSDGLLINPSMDVRFFLLFLTIRFCLKAGAVIVIGNFPDRALRIRREMQG